MLVQWTLGVIVLAYCAFNVVESAMSPAQIEKMAKGIRESCVKKVGVDPNLVAGLQKGQFPDNEDLACYTMCVMTSIRTFKNGRVNVGMVIKQVEAMMPPEAHDRMKAAATKCGPEAAGDDPCRSTYSYVKCNYDFDPEAFFFP